jgi:alpha-tubulin suppressor-like RCC1 family protein
VGVGRPPSSWLGIAVLLVVSCLSLGSSPASATPLVAATGRTAVTPGASVVSGWGQFGTDGGSHSIGDVPTSVSLEGVSAIQASNSDDYAIVGGTEYAWGYGAGGELGNGTRTNSFTTPVAVSFPADTTVTSIGDAYDSGFAVDSAGNAWSWGTDSNGDLCRSGDPNVPGLIPGMPPVKAVAGGGNHTLWLTASGNVYACGLNTDGDLGDGTFTNSSTPVEVDGPLANVAAISAAWNSSAALTSSGQLFMWGVNKLGDLGIGNTTKQDTPQQVSGTFTQVYAGGSNGGNSHTLAITTSGAVEAWGKGYGKSPVVLSLPFMASQVMAGGGESGAVDTGGNVWMWGSNKFGAVGNGQKSGSTAHPVEVDSGRSMLSGTAGNVVDCEGSG